MRYRTTGKIISASLQGLLLGLLVLKPRLPFAGETHMEAGSRTHSISVNGMNRTYEVHVPAAARPQTPVPVVIMLHGGGGSSRAAQHETGWTEEADKQGFLAVFPDALARDPARKSRFAGNPQLWNDGSERFYPALSRVNDVQFLEAVLDDLIAKHPVDQNRIYVTGFSNGASMTFRFGSALSERIAAIAPVAGVMWGEPSGLKRPVPMMYITGNADTLNPIEGGVSRLGTGRLMGGGKEKPPVRDTIRSWARLISCPEAPREVTESNGVLTERYGPCPEGGEIVYVEIEGLGHQWAGGKSLLPESWVGKGTDKFNATDEIWAFFTKHRLSEKSD